MMKRMSLIAMAAAAVVAHAIAAEPVTNVEVTKGENQTTLQGTSRVTATVVSIDSASRTVTLKTPKGKLVELEVTTEARNFDQLRVGDVVTAEYRESLTLSLMKDKTAASRTENVSAERAASGAKPGGAVGREVTIVADVVAVNPKAKTVTLKGPKGNMVDLHVEDPERLKRIHKGDQVQAVYTEALAISVEPAAK
jgi:hypothetical protein